MSSSRGRREREHGSGARTFGGTTLKWFVRWRDIMDLRLRSLSNGDNKSSDVPVVSDASEALECELLARAEVATEVLARASTFSRFDEQAIRRGLSMAREIYARLDSLTAGRCELSADVSSALNSLKRATLRSYPVLIHAALNSRARP